MVCSKQGEVSRQCERCGSGAQQARSVYCALCRVAQQSLQTSFILYCGPVSQTLLVYLADYATAFALQQCSALEVHRKHICNVVIELLQNVRMHGMGLPGGTKEQPGVLSVGFSSEELVIQVCNVAKCSAVEAIQKQLQQLNQDDPDTLRARFRVQLVKGQHSEKGGAGLGLIKVVRQFAQPLHLHSTALEEGLCLLCFSIALPCTCMAASLALD